MEKWVEGKEGVTEGGGWRTHVCDLLVAPAPMGEVEDALDGLRHHHAHVSLFDGIAEIVVAERLGELHGHALVLEGRDDPLGRPPEAGRAAPPLLGLEDGLCLGRQGPCGGLGLLGLVHIHGGGGGVGIHDEGKLAGDRGLGSGRDRGRGLVENLGGWSATIWGKTHNVYRFVVPNDGTIFVRCRK
jgi:hypothetical protein